MAHLFIRFFPALFLLLTISSCCLAIACDESTPSFNLRLIRDGKNAVFGPDAFISVDSIRFSRIIDSSLIEGGFREYPDNGFLQFKIWKEGQYLLEIPGLVADTIIARLEENDEGCCINTVVIDVRRNGVIICEENCEEEVIEIEI
jgi:hypothetical protein